jgi:hypothetical protein
MRVVLSEEERVGMLFDELSTALDLNAEHGTPGYTVLSELMTT